MSARRLSSLGSKQLAHRKGRSVLTALGIVLGVAILFGVLVSNATTKRGIERLIEDFTGRADVVVEAPGTFDSTVPGSTVARLGALPGVERAVGSFRIFSAVDHPHPTEEEPFVELMVRGIVLSEARALIDYDLASGRFFTAGAREAVIPGRLRDKLETGIGRAIEVSTPFGKQPLTIVGILTDDGAGRTNEGDIVFTSLETARALARKEGVVSGASLILSAGTDVEAWIEQHERAVGPGLAVLNAAELGEGFQEFVSLLGIMFTFFAAITLVVGAFLIYLTLSMAVIERTRVYGTMRALGATRAQVRRIVITEALTLGALSTGLGLLAGLGIAKGLLVMISGLFRIELGGLTVERPALLAGVAVGLLTTLGSSLIPAWRASRLSPVIAMKGDHGADLRASRTWILGLILFALGIALATSAGDRGAALGTVPLMLGVILMVPVLLKPVARVLGRLTNRLARGVGDVAVLHLVKERSRSAYTLALIMIVMAMIFALGGLHASMGAALSDTLDRQFGSDIHIDTPGTLDERFERELRAVPGVGPVTPIRLAETRLYSAKEPDGELTFARIIDPATYFDVEGFQFADGTERDARAGLTRGGAILVAESTAKTAGVRVGDRISLETTRGRTSFRIAGTMTVFGGPPGIVLGIRDGRRLFDAGGATAYHLNTTEPVATVRDRIDAALGARYHLEINTASSLKQDAVAEFDRYFNIFYAILFVAAITGMLGLANTLAMSVLQRYREIGVLRAIGTSRAQVWRMVLVEAATLSMVAFVLSVPLGWLLSALVVGGVSDAFGFDVAYRYPATWIPTVAAFGAGAAMLTAIAPGRRAARLQVVEALQFE